MVCDELVPPQYRDEELGGRVHASLALPSPTADLVRGWLRRGRAATAEPPRESFEPFIFTWIALNAWAASVTGFDNEREWMTALVQSGWLNESFRKGYEASPGLREAADQFAGLWPIAKVQELRRLQPTFVASTDDYGSAETRAQRLVAAGAREFEPACWARHLEAGEQVVDWPHTLRAVYRVRCNLFHGEKGADVARDQLVVKSALAVLILFMRRTRGFRDLLR